MTSAVKINLTGETLPSFRGRTRAALNSSYQIHHLSRLALRVLSSARLANFVEDGSRAG